MKLLIKKTTSRKSKAKSARKVFGKYIVADPEICHGKLTFRGTRIFVEDVLADVGSGIDWDTVIKNWHGSISREAITEALELSRKALLEHADEYAIKSARR